MCACVMRAKRVGLAYWKPGWGTVVACDYKHNAMPHGHGMERGGGVVTRSALALAVAVELAYQQQRPGDSSLFFSFRLLAFAVLVPFVLLAFALFVSISAFAFWFDCACVACAVSLCFASGGGCRWLPASCRLWSALRLIST